MRQNLKIAVCYNEPFSIYENYIGKSLDNDTNKADTSETDILQSVMSIRDILFNHYEDVRIIPFGKSITYNIDSLCKYDPDIIYNFVEAIEGNANYESYIAGLYDLLGYSYTGNNAIALGNCLDKVRTKQLLKYYGINTPKFLVGKLNQFFSSNDLPLEFPIILKLIKEDASIGISEESVVNNIEQLNSHLNFLYNNYSQAVLMEEYIEGREINVSILGDVILPISEITFNKLPKSYPRIITYEAKWSPGTIYYENTVPSCPASLNSNLENNLKNIAKKTFDLMGCRDYARIDFRIGKRNAPYVIEVNPNPDISVDSGFVRSAINHGIDYNKLIFELGTYVNKRREYYKED